MSDADEQPIPWLAAARKWLRWVIYLGLLLTAVQMIRIAVGSDPKSGNFALMLLSLGLAVGATLLHIQFRAARVHRWWILAGVIAVGLSQISYHLWIWVVPLRELDWVLRLWWITFIGSVMISHKLALRRAAIGRNDFWERATPWGAFASGVIIAGMALRPSIRATPPMIALILLAVPGALSVIGSIVIRTRWIRQNPVERTWPPSLRWFLWVVSHVIVLSLGVYVGRKSKPGVSTQIEYSGFLATLSSEQLDAQVRRDLLILESVTGSIDKMETEMDALDKTLRREIRDDRDYYTPEQEDRIRRTFMHYLNLRESLLRLVSRYRGFKDVQDGKARARCFLVGYCAGAILMEASLKLAHKYHGDEMVRHKLNEPGYHVPPRMFDRIYESTASKQNQEEFEMMAEVFQAGREKWKAEAVFEAGQMDWLTGHIQRAIGYEKDNRFNRRLVQLEMTKLRIQQDMKNALYGTQSLIATMIGDIKIVHREPFLNDEFIENQIQTRLTPGDILLERRNWNLSNAFLPGFWPHAALYIGTEAQRRKIGAMDDDAIRRQVEANLDALRFGGQLKRGVKKRLEDVIFSDGKPLAVIESVSEGVILNSLNHSMHADYVCAFRPMLTDAQRTEGIRRAVEHLGKDYDFEFDFFTEDRLVCTELVYRAYEGMLKFELIKVMGRDTLPADEIVRMFDRERREANPQLSFVLFADRDLERNRSVIVENADELVRSLRRPSTFVE